MKVIKVLSLICFLTIGVWAQAGATVSGSTLINGKIFPDMTVNLISSSGISSTTSDSSGKYKFANVKPGNYTITISVAIENQSGIIENPQKISVSNEQSQKIDLEVTLPTNFRIIKSPNSQSQLIREIVTVSADTPQTIEQVSKTVNIIDSQQLRDRADFSLAESLRTIPGFRVQQLGGFGRLASIKTRGLRNQDTAILIDGIRFRDASTITGDASPFLSDFTLTSVDRIEVLRGSGSSLYGTNAIGGTIDFQTPKPRKGPHGQIGGAFGGYGLGRFRANFTDATDDEKFGFTLGISRTAYTKGIDGQDDAHNTNFQSRLEYNPFPKTNLSGRFFVSDAYVRLNSNPNSIFAALPSSVRTIVNAIPLSREELKRYESGVPLASLNRGSANFIPDANDPDNNQKSQFFSGQFALTQIISDKLVFQGTYQGLRTQRKNDNGTLGIGFQSASTSVFAGVIQTANGHFNWTPNRHNEITAGYEYEHEDYDNHGYSPNGVNEFFVKAYQSSNTIYGQELLKLFRDKLQLAGGVRVQFFDLKNPKFSIVNALYSNLTLENPPNAYTFDGAVSYFFDRTKTKIRAHAGNGYRVPSLYERFGSGYFFGFTAYGDPNLKPERTLAFDGGIEQSLFNNRARLTATYFYTKLQQVIGFTSPAPSIGTTNRPFGGYFNTNGGLARGAEFGGQINVTRSTDVFASYTFTNSDQLLPQATNTGIITTLGIPKKQFTLTATQRFRRAWVNLDALVSSSYLAPLGFPSYVFRFKGNRRADLTGGYTFPLHNEKFSLRVYGTIENLFDNEYYENGFRTFGRNGRVGLSFGF